jgi:hypothetical protein
MATSTGVMSSYLARFLIRNLLRGSNFTLPDYYWVGVYTNPEGAGEADTGTEKTGGMMDLSRVTITLPTDIQIENNIIYNTGVLTFAEAASPGWGTIYGWGIKDAATAGNLLFWGLFDTPIIVSTGQKLRIDAGDLRITLCQANTTNGGWTVFGANEVLKYLINRTTFDWSVSGTQLALGRSVLVNNTTDNLFSSWTEISTSGTGYTRLPMGILDWSYPVDNYTKNVYEMVFTTAATADWGQVSDVVLYDNVTQANPLFWGHISSPITVNAGDGFKISELGFQVQFN